MADNLTTIEETADKIERKEKPQRLTQKLAGDIFSDNFGASSGKMSDKGNWTKKTKKKNP